MYVDGVMRFDITEQVQVPLKWYIRIVSALHQDLARAHFLGFVDLLTDLFDRERPSLGVFRPAVERAESTVGDAHVRVVDVAVHDVRDRVVRMFLYSDAIRLGA